MVRAAAICWALAGSLAFTSAAAAAPGDLDGSFSGDGWLRTLEVRSSDNNYLPRAAEDVAVQPDGRIVAVGELIDGTYDWYFGAFRYLPNGELDPSFGEGGWVDTDLGSFESAHAVAVQPDGGIVVAGNADCGYTGCFLLARYRPDGSLDPSFGEGGVTRTQFARYGGAVALDVAIADDGKIVAAGYRHIGGDAQDDAHFAVARYLPDGSLDSSFSRDGRATVDFGYGDDMANAVAVGGGGRILVAGKGTRNRYLTEDDFAFARFRRDGRLDGSFSGDGRLTLNFGGQRFDEAMGLSVRDRAIVATGSSYLADEELPSVAVARLTWDGSLAPGLGQWRTVPAPGGGYGRAALAMPDGRIVVAGRAFPDRSKDSSDWTLIRYRPGGRLDRGFGGDGVVISDFGTGEDAARALAIQDGRIIAAGSIYTQQGLARYLP